jgi:hypothetical protein
LSFNPSVKDPTKPLLFTGDENESRRHWTGKSFQNFWVWKNF